MPKVEVDFKEKCGFLCLDAAQCEIGQEGEEAQPKKVVAFAKLEKAGRTVYSALYKNCPGKETTKHAEEFMCEDRELKNLIGEGPATQQGQKHDPVAVVSEGLGGMNLEGPKLVVYLTMQPCHKSADKTPDKSCCDTLIKFKEKYLDPAGAELVIKPTFLFRVRGD